MLLKTKQIEQKSKMTLVAFFGVGREKLLFLTQKRVGKEGCTRVEIGTKMGRKRVGKVTKDGREGKMKASQERLATGTIASAKPMTTEKKKADTEGSHKKTAPFSRTGRPVRVVYYP